MEAARIVMQEHDILLPNGPKIVKNHFVDDSLLSIRGEKDSIIGILVWILFFCNGCHGQSL